MEQPTIGENWASGSDDLDQSSGRGFWSLWLDAASTLRFARFRRHYASEAYESYWDSQSGPPADEETGW